MRKGLATGGRESNGIRSKGHYRPDNYDKRKERENQLIASV